MKPPAWLTRKLFVRGSLRETRTGFTFRLQNVLSSAQLVAPPRIVVNGVDHPPERIEARRVGGDVVDVPAISPKRPLGFPRGSRWRLDLTGRLLMGPNRVQIVVETEEFGPLEIFVEEQAAAFCDLGDEEE